MTLTNIEKAAKLMGYQVESVADGGVWIIEHDKPLNRDGEHPIRLINPYTNKADLVDVECSLEIDIEWFDTVVMAYKYGTGREILSDHHNKFTARAHAVMAVVEQIYDRREG